MTKYARFSPDPRKIAAAVIYLAERSMHDESFGETKLVKLLYYADCTAYQRTGKPITGANYIRMNYGPYPEGWQSMERRLRQEGAISVIEESIAGSYQRRRVVPRRQLESEVLTDQDRGILDEQLQRFAKFNAQEIEDYSHQELGWRRANRGEVIPYELAGFRIPKLTEDIRERGQRIADDIRKRGYRIANDVTPRHQPL